MVGMELPGGDWSLAPRGGDGKGGTRDDSPVLAPEAEHVCVVGARLHRLEALERRHGVAEQEPAYTYAMRAKPPESARAVADSQNAVEDGTFVGPEI